MDKWCEMMWGVENRIFGMTYGGIKGCFQEVETESPYSEIKIEKVPFESRQETKSPIRRKYDTIFSFPNDK